MLQILTTREKEAAQRRGYMCEHLLCFYSMVSTQTALFDGNFPVFLNPCREADVILFGLDDRAAEGLSCVRDLMALPLSTINIVAPTPFHELPQAHTRYVDWDYHIDVAHFDLELKGHAYKHLRSRVHQVAALGYHARRSRVFTPQHTYLLSRHMARHPLEVWDYEELLSLERFFRDHDHGLMIEAYHGDQLVGFDVVDFVDDDKVLVVPLGIYLDRPLVSDFLMYEDLQFARERGCDWVDVGLTCGSDGLRSFKEKWFAKPKFTLHVSTMTLPSPHG
jgi:hypothetical protein